jgi:hypothetical protein
MPNPGDGAKVLLSFGATSGGFEFAMALRAEIYQKFSKNADADPEFCYLDAESLRGSPDAKYNYDQFHDLAVMSMRDWDTAYRSAMDHCRTMILLVTKQWLISKWCWHELNMLVDTVARRTDVKVIAVFWPDAMDLLRKGSWIDKQPVKNKFNVTERTPQQLYDSLTKIGSRLFAIYVSAAKGPGITVIENRGSMGFMYACSQEECGLILAQINAG